MTNQGKSGHGEGDYRRQMIRRGPVAIGKIEKAQDPRRALFRLAALLKPYKARLAIVLVFVLVSTGLGLIGPYLMGRAIDGFIGTKDTRGLAVIAVWMLAVYLAGNLADAASGWLVAS
ncbi:MAG: ABC transporter ATP-binding protein, partial [Chloroflexi bacterium]